MAIPNRMLGLTGLTIRSFLRMRALGFVAESALVSGLSKFFGQDLPGDSPKPDRLKRLAVLIDALFAQDSENILRGVYPVSVLLPESPVAHARRIPAVLLDTFLAGRRRLSGKTTVFSKKARKILEGLPRYYQRNFHFQTDGYLSSWSAKLYEHEVEVLFLGAADAMRRMVIAPLHEVYQGTGGKGLKILEIGCGTGRATQFVSQAFPEARITALDLSRPYLERAKNAKGRPTLQGVDWIEGQGENLPFKDGHFDAVYSVFLFHELPRETRLQVLREAHRVLKSGGILSLVDSMQVVDCRGDREGLDELLSSFPAHYHEPFFRDYCEKPLEELAVEAGFSSLRTSQGFVSKSVSARP